MSDKSIILRDGEIRELLERGEVRVLRPIKSELRSHSDGRKRRVFMRSDILEVNELLSRRQEHPLRRISCPAGTVGSRLWVRETWQGPLLSEQEVADDPYWPSHIERYQDTSHCEYAADGGPAPEFSDPDDNLKCGWRPSIHMPRWASRLSVMLSAVSVDSDGAGLVWAYQLKRVD